MKTRFIDEQKVGNVQKFAFNFKAYGVQLIIRELTVRILKSVTENLNRFSIMAFKNSQLF